MDQAEERRAEERQASGQPPELESFYRVGRFLGSILDIEELLKAILEEGLAAVGGTRGFVGIVNRSTGELDIRITAGAGWDAHPFHSFAITDDPGRGIVVRVAASGIPYVTGDVRQDRHYLCFFPDTRSEIAVPLVNRDGRVIGVINVESEQVDAFSHRDLQLLVALANQAAIAISVASYRVREVLLVEIGNRLASATDMDELFKRVVRAAQQLLRTDDCSLFQLDPGGERLILRATGPMLQERVGQLTYRLGEGLTGWTAQHQGVTRVTNVREDARWRGLYPGLPEGVIESFLAVPVFERSTFWGLLRVLRRHPGHSIVSNDFTDRDQTLLMTLAGQVGAAITQQTLIQRQMQMERMAAWGEMSARSAHMIGNKVFALKGQLNELEHLARQASGNAGSVSGAEIHSVVERAKQGVFRLEEILNEFRDFLMATHLERQPTDLAELVRSTVEETLGRGSSPYRLDLGPELPGVLADAAKLRRALSELLENAVNHQMAHRSDGEISVSVGLWTEADRRSYPQVPFTGPWTDERTALRIDVRDQGPGIPAENKGKLFIPFFTTRSKGMGLGLSIVKGIVDAHRGAIAEVGEEGVGAHFIIVLPARPSDSDE